MTNEERITALEDAVSRLGRIEELRQGPFDRAVDSRIVADGAEFHHWVRAVQEHRAGT